MTFPTCSLWILVARTDLPFMMDTIPHIMRMSRFPFAQKVLAIDTAPLSGEKRYRPGVGTLEQLRHITSELLQSGIIDRVVDVNYEPHYRDYLMQKHFGYPLKATHNYKGYPILGSIFTIEECKSDYMLHFDSDMLLHQAPNYDWVKEAITLMEKHPHMMSCRPLAGPPTATGEMYQIKDYQKNPEGFYQFKFFGSRVYLINRRRFEDFLPLPILWRPYKTQWLKNLPPTIQIGLNYLRGKGDLDSWEVMVSNKQEVTPYYRAVLANPQAWTLHPKDRSSAFIKALPQLIAKIEQGYYPPLQAGHYDVIPELWY